MITFDYERARAYANEYAAKPTPGRAHNAAAHLTPALDEIDRLRRELAPHNNGGLPGRYWLTDAGVAATEPDVPMPTRRSSAPIARQNGKNTHRISTVPAEAGYIATCSCGKYTSEIYFAAAVAMEMGTDKHFAEVWPGLGR